MVPISTAKKSATRKKVAVVDDNQMPLDLKHRAPYAAAVHTKVVIAKLRCSMSWGNITDERLTDDVEESEQAEKGSVKVRKKLLPGESGAQLKKVQQLLGEFKSYHYKHTWRTETEGQRLLPVAFYVDYMGEFNATEERGLVAMNELIERYPAAIERAKTVLRGAFNPLDYPPLEELRRYYQFGVRFLPVPAGAAMPPTMKGLASDVDSYVNELLQDATNQAKVRLRKAIERLVPYKNPKSRVYDTAMEGIDEVINLLPAMNLTDDPEITNIVAEVKAKLYGWAPDDLRANAATRSQVAKAAEEILKRMGG